VTTDYKERDNAFTGKTLKVTADVKPIGAWRTGLHSASMISKRFSR
jgi:hypothetical protein